eukprot:352491-Chlamydomonas_euryale.AAC.2
MCSNIPKNGDASGLRCRPSPARSSLKTPSQAALSPLRQLHRVTECRSCSNELACFDLPPASAVPLSRTASVQVYRRDELKAAVDIGKVIGRGACTQPSFAALHVRSRCQSRSTMEMCLYQKSSVHTPPLQVTKLCRCWATRRSKAMPSEWHLPACLHAFMHACMPA